MNLRTNAIVCTFTALLAAGYFLHICGPLRLNHDSGAYGTLGALLADGFPYPKTHYPPAYPLTIAAMDRLGLGNGPALLSLNLIALALGLPLLWLVLADLGLERNERLAICLTMACGWRTIELSAELMPDLIYFSLSMGVFCCVSRKTLAWLILATVLSFVAICYRNVGVALLPAVSIAWLQQVPNRKQRVLLVVLGSIVAAITLPHMLSGDYFQQFIRGNGDIPYPNFRTRVWWRTDECLSVFGNLLTARDVPFWMRVFLTSLILGACGAGMISRGGPAAGYVAIYSAIVAVYPYPGTRYWLPVQSLLMAFGWIGISRFLSKSSAVRAIATIYVVAFCALGTWAMARSVDYSVRALDPADWPSPLMLPGDSLQCYWAQPLKTTADIANLPRHEFRELNQLWLVRRHYDSRHFRRSDHSTR